MLSRGKKEESSFHTLPSAREERSTKNTRGAREEKTEGGNEDNEPNRMGEFFLPNPLPPRTHDARKRRGADGRGRIFLRRAGKNK